MTANVLVTDGGKAVFFVSSPSEDAGVLGLGEGPIAKAEVTASGDETG